MKITRVEDLADKIKERVPAIADTQYWLSVVGIVSKGINVAARLESAYRGYRITLGDVEPKREYKMQTPKQLADECELIVVDDLKARAFDYLKKNFPVYYEFLNKCIVAEGGADCPTAYIMFNELLGEYEIRYNKRFILEKAVQDAILWDSTSGREKTESLVKSTAFVFMHEMMHALRYHMSNQESAVSGFNGRVVNIMGDSFINTELQKVMDIPLLYDCIDSEVGFSGKAKSRIKVGAFVKELADWYKQLTNERVRFDSFDIGTIAKDEPITIFVTVTKNGQEALFGGNSNIYINELISILSKYLETESAESGAGEGKESSNGSGGQSGPSNGASGSPGDSGDAGDSNSGNGSTGSSSSGSGAKSGSTDGEDGQKGESASSSGGSGSGSGSGYGGSTSQASARNNADETLNSAAAKKKAQTNIEEAINSVPDGDKSDEDSKPGTVNDKSGELLKSVGADKLARNFKNIQSWKAKLSRYLNECLGTSERYNSELANARIEGQYGREEDINIPKRIILSFDCSGSMGPEKFRQVIGEVENFLVANKYKHIEIICVYWGSDTPTIHRMKLNKGLTQKIIGSGQSSAHGGTELCTCLNAIKTKYRKFDLMIVFTDGEIYDTPSDENKAFMRRISNRVIWVLTRGGNAEHITRHFDKNCKRRLIKAK